MMAKAARISAAIVLAIALMLASASEAVGKEIAKPRPAEMVARASSGLLLDVTKAGPGWIAVGDHGLVLRSEDGRQWKQLAVPVDTTLNRVRFLDDQRGWIVGYDGCVLQSLDGGRSWQLAQYEGSSAKPYFDVLFTDVKTGWLAGSDGVLKHSIDGGENWETVSSEALQDQQNLYALKQLGDGSLLLVGERGFIAHSVNNGTSWSVLKSPYSGAYFGALPAGEHGALLFGLRGNVFHAPDLDRAAKITAADREALRIAAADPQASTLATTPVSAVTGWTPLSGVDGESLFGGTQTATGRLLLFGNNGRVMEADLVANKLRLLSQASGANFSAGVVANEALIVVGSSGLRRMPLVP